MVLINQNEQEHCLPNNQDWFTKEREIRDIFVSSVKYE